MKMIKTGAAIALAGYILSGPVGFLCVRFLSPQPAWVSAQVFAANYSVLQDLPSLFGFLLIGGTVALATGLYGAANEKEKGMMLLALLTTIVFACLISFNYICQTTFVRNMATHYKQEYDTAITAFSMANPLSLAWSVEMWGYAILGIATWLWRAYYNGRSKIIPALLTANGVVSISTALLALVNLEWIMSAAGLIGYMVWNVLMIALMVLVYRDASAKTKNGII